MSESEDGSVVPKVVGGALGCVALVVLCLLCLGGGFIGVLTVLGNQLDAKFQQVGGQVGE